MNQDNINNNNNSNEDISMYYPDGDAKNIYRDDHDDSFLLENKKRKDLIKKKKAALSKPLKTLLIVFAVIYVVIIAVAAWFILYDPADHTDSEIPFDTRPIENINPPLDNDNENEGNDKQTPPEETTDYTEREGTYNFLVIGHDVYANLADVTMIVNFNTADSSITVMQIPRDTLVTIDVDTNKVNATYASFFYQSYYDDNQYASAAEKITQFYEQSLCINIHHTVLMDLEGFRNIVNALGGVDIYVPKDMYYEDPEQNLYISLPQGNQHLDGYQAECFVRFRSGFLQADIGRVNAQKIFMTAFFNKVKATVKSVDVGTLSTLASEVSKSVYTDLTVSDIVFYVRHIVDIDLSSINMMTIPGGVEKTGIHYVINREGTLEMINKYFNVYKGDISDSIFDRNKVFCFDDIEAVSDVYYADPDTIIKYVYNAQDIDEDSIYIP